MSVFTQDMAVCGFNVKTKGQGWFILNCVVYFSHVRNSSFLTNILIWTQTMIILNKAGSCLNLTKLNQFQNVNHKGPVSPSLVLSNSDICRIQSRLNSWSLHHLHQVKTEVFSRLNCLLSLVRFIHKKHLLSVKKTSWFGLKYLFQSTRSLMEMVQLPLKNRQFLLLQKWLEIPQVSWKAVTRAVVDVCEHYNKRKWTEIQQQTDFFKSSCCTLPYLYKCLISEENKLILQLTAINVQFHV